MKKKYIKTGKFERLWKLVRQSWVPAGRFMSGAGDRRHMAGRQLPVCVLKKSKDAAAGETKAKEGGGERFVRGAVKLNSSCCWGKEAS